MSSGRRVELWGPSGVGKTSIMDKASALRQAGRWWLNAREVDDRINPSGLSGAAALNDVRLSFDGFKPAALVDGCFEIILRSSMLPSQKIAALQMLKSTCAQSMRFRALELSEVALHDELLIHRSIALLAYSADFQRDVAWYFETVPAPDIVVAVTATPQTIMERSLVRGRSINTYYGLNVERQYRRVELCLEMMEIGQPILQARGVKVVELDGELPIAENCVRLNEVLSTEAACLPTRN